jgi:glycosyltransferase involved in cell wall biosynthesis
MLENKRNSLFIGALNLNFPPNGGEEYKNQLLCREFAKMGFKLAIVDTHNWRIKPRTWLMLFTELFVNEHNNVIISAASKSTYSLIRIIRFCRPSLLKKTHYFVIGGFFPQGVEIGIYKNKYYQDLKSIVVEGSKLKIQLSKLGIQENVVVIPNFKPNFKLNQTLKSENKWRFIFISTICKEKGVDLIFEAINELQKTFNGQNNLEVDLYGPIEKNYRFSFYQSLDKYKNLVNYRGYLNIIENPQHSYEMLSTYDVMLFPTMYKGEGFPGVLIDAMIAGIPVIVSDWNMNSEVVKDGVTGFLMRENTARELSLIMRNCMVDKMRIQEIGKENRMLAEQFSPSYIVSNRIIPLLK